MNINQYLELILNFIIITPPKIELNINFKITYICYLFRI